MTTIAVIGTYQLMVDALRRALPDEQFVRVDRGGPFAAAAGAELALGWAGPEAVRALLEVAPVLRWIHTTSAGVDRLLIPELSERPGFVLTNNSGSYDAPIGEFVIAAMFAAAKHLPDYQRAQAERRWAKGPEASDERLRREERVHAPAALREATRRAAAETSGSNRLLEHLELREATLVVFGMGSIGGEVARLACALGVRVIGVRRRLGSGGIPGVAEVVGPDRLAEVAAEADFLAVTAPLTPATRGIVSAQVIARMKPTGWIINIARGAIVDEPALLSALKERRIGGAAIDAWWTEPLPPESEWWSLPNVIATPHVSHSSPRVRERTLALFLENYRRWRTGEPLLNVVDFGAGY